jgi:hypothetical protein
MITTKAIAFPSSRFLSMWTLIEQHSSLRKLQQNNKPWLLPFNSVSAMREAQQHFGCAAFERSKFVYGKPPRSTIPFAPGRGHSSARRGSVRSGGLCPPWHSLQKKAFERLSRISSATMVKRMITTKAIAAPSRCFLSVWIRIGSTPLCGSCKTNKPSCRRSNRVPAMREAQQHPGPLPAEPCSGHATGLFLSRGGPPIRQPSITFASKSGQAGRACGCRSTMSRADRPCRDGWRQTLDPKRTDSRRGSKQAGLRGS